MRTKRLFMTGLQWTYKLALSTVPNQPAGRAAVQARLALGRPLERVVWHPQAASSSFISIP